MKRARGRACPRSSTEQSGPDRRRADQPDFQAGAADHRTHFANAVPRFVREAMAEYGELTGRIPPV